MQQTTNMMIVGVGGQGTLLASKLVGAVMLARGLDVKVSEVHGMSQRGGSVVTYVRWGKAVASPLIEHGEADYMLAFELLEAARYLPYLKKGGQLVVNARTIDPMPVITGAAVYPANLTDKLAAQSIDLICCDAFDLAAQAGNAKAVNVVLIGVLARLMDIPAEQWKAAIQETVPARFLEINQNAFDLGYHAVNGEG
jgi:Pyruvate:ferredoxin oxidoreductase and related 2-oxoacid:ferredoxin oxidoreductases, gamma subunit